jgi:hypothetical protein
MLDSASGAKVSDRQFVVLYSAYSLARYRPSEAHFLNEFPASPGIGVNVMLCTRYEEIGKTAPLPRQLFLEVKCSAGSLDEAVTFAFGPVSILLTMIALTANAAVHRPLLFLAYESTPGLNRRRYLQYSQEPNTGPPKPGRFIDRDLLSAIMHSPEHSSYAASASRAAQQYQYALIYRTSATRVLAVAHLYMACEAMSEAIEEFHRAKLGMTRKEHAELLGISTSSEPCTLCGRPLNWRFLLKARARRKYLFNDDHELYKKVRTVSDGFEHGFMDATDVRIDAEEVVDAMFAVVRKGIFDLLEIHPDLRTRLNELSPLDNSEQSRSFESFLVGNVEDVTKLAAIGQTYPFLEWTTEIVDATISEDEFSVDMIDHVNPVCASGVEFEPPLYTSYGKSKTDSDSTD